MLPAAVAACAAACVVTYEEAPLVATPAKAPLPLAVSQTIPFPAGAESPDQRALLDVYGGVLDRLHAAAADRDVEQVRALLANYERSDLPPWLRDVLAGYRQLLGGLEFQAHAAKVAAVTVVPEAPGAVVPPPLGAPVRFELRLPAAPFPVRLGGEHDADPAGFLVAVTIEDRFVDGGSRTAKSQDTVWLPAAFELARDTVLTVPFGVDVPAGGSVRRTVHLRVDLMPGYALVDGVRAPLQRTNLGSVSTTMWPVGYEEIAREPLASMRAALQRQDPANLPRILIAAYWLPVERRAEALPWLVEAVRLGDAAKSRVAMAALRTLTGEDLPVGDREAWLAWWQARG